MTKCYQIYAFISTVSHITDGCIDFSWLKGVLEADMFSLLCSSQPTWILDFFSPREIWNIRKQMQKCVLYYDLSERETRIFAHKRRIQMLLSLGIVGVCNIFTSRPCLIALSCRNRPLTYYSPERVFFFFSSWPTPGACTIRHMNCQSCTCNSLTCIPMMLSVLSSSLPV